MCQDCSTIYFSFAIAVASMSSPHCVECFFFFFLYKIWRTTNYFHALYSILYVGFNPFKDIFIDVITIEVTYRPIKRTLSKAFQNWCKLHQFDLHTPRFLCLFSDSIILFFSYFSKIAGFLVFINEFHVCVFILYLIWSSERGDLFHFLSRGLKMFTRETINFSPLINYL